MQIPHLPGNRRRLLQFSFTRAEEELTAVGPSAGKNPCGNGQNSVQCPSASSTVLIVVLVMSTMMIAVLIAIILLCWSHYTYRQTMERQQQQMLREEQSNRAAVIPVIEGPGSADNMVLVLLPGEKEPVACAHISPLHS